MFLSRIWILVSLAIGAASFNTDNYKKLGGEAVLSTSSVSDPLTSITWKHGADIAVEWYGQETVAYREFKDRCKLDFNTGALTISNLTVKDSGMYTAEINNKVMSPTKITVISAVPKPTVSTQCISEGTRCTFTCEANVTGAEPVTYSWMVDGENITSSSKSLEKEKDDPEMVGKPIRCQLENPVSNERSDDVIIPFTNSNYVGAIVGVVVAIGFVIVVAVGLFICYRRRRRSQNLNEDVSPCFACFSKRSSQSSETPGGPQQQTSGDAEDSAHEGTLLISQNNGFVQHEARDQEQDPESAQTGNEDEPSGRSQDDTPGQTEGAEEEKAQISMSNGTVAFTTVDEIHNQEQNSESTQSKHEPEPSGRSQDDTPVQTEEGAEEKFTTTSEVKVESGKDQKPAASTDSSSKPETSKTTSEVKDESGKDQTPAASTDSSSIPDMPALDSQSNETSDSEAKPETDNLQEPQQGPERTT